MRAVYRNSDDVGDFELGKAAFYLNRTNVSGILSGGVIGGLKQAGNYKMDVRFNRETLKKKSHGHRGAKGRYRGNKA